MGFLSKIYERRGKAQRQASIKGFLTKGVVGSGSGYGAGDTRGSEPAGSSPSRVSGNAVGRETDPRGDPAEGTVTHASGGKHKTARTANAKPDAFDFETSRDAALEEAPLSPSTRSPPMRSKPKPENRPAHSPATSARCRSSPGCSDKNPLSPGMFGAARDAVCGAENELPYRGDGDVIGKLLCSGRKGGEPVKTFDPFLPTPGKRRRVTFAEVDAFTLDEEDDDDEIDVPAHGRRSPAKEEEAMETEKEETMETEHPKRNDDKNVPNDPFDFGETLSGDDDAGVEKDENGMIGETACRDSPGATVPSWGMFGGSPPASPVVKSPGSALKVGTLTAPSPEWAKTKNKSSDRSRSRSGSPMETGDGVSGDAGNRDAGTPNKGTKTNAQHYTHAHSPSAAMAMASPSPMRDARTSTIPESSDALAALDEAQYALSGLGDDAPLAGRLACASSLVAICAEPRFRRALAQHGLAPRVCRAALDLCASVVGVSAKRGAKGVDPDDHGVIARALREKCVRSTSPALGLSAAALLYLSTLELRASEACATYAERDVAGILAGLMRHTEFSASEESESSKEKEKGARKKLGLGGGGFASLLADGAEAKALKLTRDALRSLKFLPHERADAPTLAMLAAHRALAQIERTAARASQRDAQRRARAEAEAERKARNGAPTENEDCDAMDDTTHDDDETDARIAYENANDAKAAKQDEAAIQGWGDFKVRPWGFPKPVNTLFAHTRLTLFKERLAANGAMLETARLADAAARTIVEVGSRCFSRGSGDPQDGGVVLETITTTSGRGKATTTTRGRGKQKKGKQPEQTTTTSSKETPEKQASLFAEKCALDDAEDARRACAAMARLFRCMRVVEAATFGSSSCAEACVSGSLAPGPQSVTKTTSLTLVPMRVNDAIASPAPVRVRAKAAEHNARDAVEHEHDVDVGLTEVVGEVRVTGIELSPPDSPCGDDAVGGSTSTKRRKTGSLHSLHDETEKEEHEGLLAKRFRTAEALLLTPSPGAKRGTLVSSSINASSRVIEFASGERVTDAKDAKESGAADQSDHVMGSPAAREGTEDEPNETTPTFNFSRVAAAVDASIAWLDDGTETETADRKRTENAQKGGPAWTMVHSLLTAIPTLAAAAACSTHAIEAGETICGVSTKRPGGFGPDPRLCAGTLRAVVCVLTNLTNENHAGCAAVRAVVGGLETAAALIPWCASLGGMLPGAGPDTAQREAAAQRSTSGGASRPGETAKLARRRGGLGTENSQKSSEPSEDAGGLDMLNAALCFLVNVAEMDGDSCRTLRALEADLGALEQRQSFRKRTEDDGDGDDSLGDDVGGDAKNQKQLSKKSTRQSNAKKKKTAAAQSFLHSRHVGLVELLAQVFVRSGGAGPVDELGNLLPSGFAGEAFDGTGVGGSSLGKKDSEGMEKTEVPETKKDVSDEADGEVTAEMLEAREKQGDGLITQAYAALLVAFLVENQPALRADLGTCLPPNGFANLAAVLERFRTFHESLESISDESRESLTRVIRWLRGN